MQNALERRQEILSALNARRHDTLDNLAHQFDVSKMTVRRDIEALSAFQPIYTVQGSGGGVFMIDGCYAGRKYMTDKQEGLLQRLLPALDGDDAETLRSVLKFFAAPKKRREDNAAKGGRHHADNSKNP